MVKSYGANTNLVTDVQMAGRQTDKLIHPFGHIMKNNYVNGKYNVYMQKVHLKNTYHSLYK